MRSIERTMKLAETASSRVQLDKLAGIYRDPLRNMRMLEKMLVQERSLMARAQDSARQVLVAEQAAFIQARDLVRENLLVQERAAAQARDSVREWSAIVALSADLARVVKPYEPVFASMSSWESSLAARMKELPRPWMLRADPSLSLLGFAHLSRLSDAVHVSEPYSAPVGELVAEELGDGYEPDPEDAASERDEAAVRGGVNPGLIAFPSGTYDEVAAAAGFSFRFPPIAPLQAEKSADHGADFDPTHGQLFTALEQHLRRVVEKTLTEKVGPRWIEQRVPSGMRRRWEELREKERSCDRPVYALVQYADFMDLKNVICENWKDGFKSIFKSQNDLNASFVRLHPVRNAISHSRPLGRADVLTLLSEATRIFSALGIRILT